MILSRGSPNYFLITPSSETETPEFLSSRHRKYKPSQGYLSNLSYRPHNATKQNNQHTRHSLLRDRGIRHKFLRSPLFAKILNHSLREISQLTPGNLRITNTDRKSIRVNPILNHRNTQRQLRPVQVSILNACQLKYSTLHCPIHSIAGPGQGKRATYKEDGDLVEDVDDLARGLALVVCLGRHWNWW